MAWTQMSARTSILLALWDSTPFLLISRQIPSSCVPLICPHLFHVCSIWTLSRKTSKRAISGINLFACFTWQTFSIVRGHWTIQQSPTSGTFGGQLWWGTQHGCTFTSRLCLVAQRLQQWDAALVSEPFQRRKSWVSVFDPAESWRSICRPSVWPDPGGQQGSLHQSIRQAHAW